MEPTEEYVPIALEGIEPVIFPDVALFVKNGSNYVLYKSNGREFTGRDHERLTMNRVEFLYVVKEDMEVITKHMEASAERMLKSPEFSSKTKGKILYQTSINFVDDLFSNPDKTSDIDRTKRLIENLILYLSENAEALQSLETVMNHNYHTFVHSIQVASLSLLIHSDAYSLSHDEMLDVGAGAILHDFGKIFIPQEILSKTGKLSEAEIKVLKCHPEDGYQFLQQKASLPPVSLSIIRHHHERCNGTGYPLGLMGRDISRSVQVTGIADVYCLLTTDKKGQNTMSPNLAVQMMRNEMKGAFNPQMLDHLEKLVKTEDTQQLIL
jgi:HD-GYP domain-containing protein (c-di-GMP phosphodiesterase class II)